MNDIHSMYIQIYNYVIQDIVYRLAKEHILNNIYRLEPIQFYP